MLRLSEIVTLETGAVNLSEGIVRVRGKGRKQREVPIGLKVQKAIHFWLNRHRRRLPGTLLFVKQDGSGLTGDRVEKIISKLECVNIFV